MSRESLPLLGLRLVEPRTATQHDVIAILVELDDLGVDLTAYVRLQIAHTALLHQRGGHEAAQAYVHDQTSFDHLDHLPRNRSASLVELLDVAPSALILGSLLGEDEATLLVLTGYDQGFQDLAHRHLFGRIYLVADAQFPGRYHTLGLVADVEQDFVAIDPDHGSVDDLTVDYGHHAGGVSLFEADVAEIVGDDLTGDVGAVLVEGAHLVKRPRCGGGGRIRQGGHRGGEVCRCHVFFSGLSGSEGPSAADCRGAAECVADERLSMGAARSRPRTRGDGRDGTCGHGGTAT